MKTIILAITTMFLSFLIQKGKAQTSNNLKEKITQLDSTFFAAYNNCDMKTQADFYSDTIEFFHDKSGLTTDKQKILADTKKYICGKVSRELIPGSIEVSPLPNYGAVEIGMHQFRNKLEPNAQPHPSRFIIIWKQEGENWKITKVISLHEN
jgi:ketosteroid isomerase-like protein